MGLGHSNTSPSGKDLAPGRDRTPGVCNAASLLGVVVESLLSAQEDVRIGLLLLLQVLPLLQDSDLLLLLLWDLYLLPALLQSSVICLECSKCTSSPMAGPACAETPLLSAENIGALGPVWVASTRQAGTGWTWFSWKICQKHFPLQKCMELPSMGGRGIPSLEKSRQP